MMERAQKAEEDIIAGRVYTFDEAKKKSDENLRQHVWDAHQREAIIKGALKS